MINTFGVGNLRYKEKFMRKGSVYVTVWGAMRESNQLRNKEGWYLYFMGIVMHPKLVQEGGNCSG